MKYKRDLFVLLFVILYILVIVVLSLILKRYNWYLRSWIYELNLFIVNISILVFLICRLIHSRSALKKILLIILMIIFSIVAYFCYIFSRWGIKFDSIEKIDNNKYVAVTHYTNRLAKDVYYYSNYNIFTYYKSKEHIEEFYTYDNYRTPSSRTYYNELGRKVILFNEDGTIKEEKSYDKNNNLILLDVKIEYDEKHGKVFEKSENIMKIGISLWDKSSYEEIILSENAKVINFDNDRVLYIADIEIGDFVTVFETMQESNNKDTIIVVAKEEFINNKAQEKLIDNNISKEDNIRLDTSILYYNKDDKYVIADIPIATKEINNFQVNVSYYLRLEMRNFTKVYLDVTESHKVDSKILLNELCFITLETKNFPYLNDSYGIKEIEFFGD